MQLRKQINTHIIDIYMYPKFQMYPIVFFSSLRQSLVWRLLLPSSDSWTSYKDWFTLIFITRVTPFFISSEPFSFQKKIARDTHLFLFSSSIVHFNFREFMLTTDKLLTKYEVSLCKWQLLSTGFCSQHKQQSR